MIDLAAKRVVVTGGSGFLGRVVCETLRKRGCRTILVPRRRDYDLTAESEVRRMYADLRPQIVLHLAAEVGGIGANRAHPGRFFYANMAMGLHLIDHARLQGVEKFVQVGTVCAYPKFTPVPFREQDLWNGYPEETNAPYGVAKKALFVMLDAYYREYGLASAIALPVNLYGPGDNFDLQSGHVIPSLIRKCIEAREVNAESVNCWGTGSASREFLYVEDAAEGIVRLAERIEEPVPINLGNGTETTIRDLLATIVEITGYSGAVHWDRSKPDGQPRRCLDTSLAANLLGWRAQVPLRDGLEQTIRWYEAKRARRAA